MRGDELALRNAAIVAALQRGENVYDVAATAELGVPTVRIIAMGGGVSLSKAQNVRPAVPEPAPKPQRPRVPLNEHLAVMDRRNQTIAAQLRDPAVPVEAILVEHRISESILLTIGWDKGVWSRPRQPKGEEKAARDKTIIEALSELHVAGVDRDRASGAALRRFGVSTARAHRLASDAGLDLRRDQPRGTRGPSRKAARRNPIIAKELTDGTATVEDLAERFEITVEYVARLARDAEVSGPLPRRERGSPADASQRDRAIVERVVERGETLRAVAARFEISAERVRQIVERDSDVEFPVRLEVRRATKKSQQVEQVIASVRGDPNHELTWRDLADRSGLPSHDVQRIVGPLETARRYPTTEPARFEVPPAIAEMRRVWLVERPAVLTGAYYDEHRRPSMVSAQSISNRLGSWRRACATAGVPFRAVRDHYERDWELQDCLNWVGLFLQDTQDVASQTYGRWCVNHPEAPSRYTVVGQLGSWAKVLHQAVASIDGKTWRDPTNTPVVDT